MTLDFEVSPRAQRLAARWIFPGLVAAMVIGNQGWSIGPLLIGQALSWVNDAAAAALVFGRFRRRLWPFVVLAVVVLAKLTAIAGIMPAEADLLFDIALCLLFCAAGAIIVSERPGIVYRQILVICALSIPLMLVQMTGVAKWSETLNTEHTEDIDAPQWTLFVPEADLHYRTTQARPNGLTHSNNFVSLIAVFALALHFSRIKQPRLVKRDLVICIFALLTMAKIVLLMYAVVLAWKLVTGVRVERLRMVRVSAATAVLLVAYAFFFPGLFAANTSLYKVGYSFYIRANNLVDMLPPGNPVTVWLAGALAGTPRATWEAGATLSGYSQLIAFLPLVIVAGMLAAPLFYRGLLNVRRRYPEAVDMMVLTLFVVLLYPTAVPMLRAQIFWFIGGFALLPLFTVWEPRRFPGMIGNLFQPPPGAARVSS